MAAFAMLSVRPLLERVREACEGPLVLMKGPEIAIRYPGAARLFIDVDLLTARPRLTHRQLLLAGFVEASGPELLADHHHLPPLRCPGLPLLVEIHGGPNWPDGLKAPAAAEIIGPAVPSGLGIDGILVPDGAQHALLVAAHAWAHEPLRRLRDLVDVRALSATEEPVAIERAARAWRITRLWRTTDRVTDAILGRRRMPFVVGLWAGHLSEQRERTVLENHLRAWVAAYWALPVRSALATTARAMRDDISPAADEGWLDKISRMLSAATSATDPLSQHEQRLGEAATRGRVSKPKGDATNSDSDAS